MVSRTRQRVNPHKANYKHIRLIIERGEVLPWEWLGVGNCDIRVYENISVSYKNEWNKILVKSKVFVRKFFCFWLTDFEKLLDEIFPQDL
jgi:hypothetical protein